MKRKNIFIILGIVLVSIVIALILWGVFGGLSIIPLPIQTDSTVWFGVPVTITSLGTHSQTNNFFWNAKCGDDGDVTISSSFSYSRLSTEARTSRRACESNFIQAELTILGGTLTGNCNLFATDEDIGEAGASCNIKSGLSTLFNKEFQTGQLMAGVPPQTSDTASFELTFDEPTQITILLIASPIRTWAVDSRASASISLDFREKDSCEGITCLDYCDGSVINDNGRCVEGECVYISRTCSFGCEDAQCSISQPETPQLSSISKFFTNIWEWIKGWFS